MWKKSKGLLKNIWSELSEQFKAKFGSTFQFLLDNYLSDYFENAQDLKVLSLLKGIENLKLNKKFINQLLGVGSIQLHDSNLGKLLFTTHLAGKIRYNTNEGQLELEDLSITFLQLNSIDEGNYKKYFREQMEATRKEQEKLKELKILRKEIYVLHLN